jgi:outer membrane protein TolC
MQPATLPTSGSVSQELPYPGKLRLRGEAAKTEADVARTRVESVRRSVIQQLKTVYFQLSYEFEELRLLDRDGKLLDHVARIAEANYRVGKGNQQDVLKAQLERSKLPRNGRDASSRALQPASQTEATLKSSSW